MKKKQYLCTEIQNHKMMKRFFILFAWLPIIAAGQRLEECQAAAERNYPLIRQYDLVARTTDLTLSSIQRGWLPQLSVNAQVSYQSDVTSWPEQIQAMYQQAGLDMKGLDKFQYRVGLDLNQPVYDGGVMRSRQRVTRAEGEVQAAQTEVTLYHIRQRVNEMFFSLLLVQEQLRLNDERTYLLQENEKTVTALYNRGTASESEVQTIRAEVLDAHRQQTTLTSRQRVLQRMLSLFCGIEITEPVKPQEWNSLSEELNRPELKLVEAQLRLANAQDRALNSALTPRLSVFASGFYGYPGYNLFNDMMYRNGSLNGIVGARLTWSLSPFYTRRNDRAKIQVQREMAETNRELFLFNTRLERLRQDEQTEQYRQLMRDDEQIITLRTAIRQAAESKMQNGVISVNDLLKEINSENAARVQLSIHEIELLKNQYDQRFTTNN
jgi:outer membrane protein TolC